MENKSKLNTTLLVIIIILLIIGLGYFFLNNSKQENQDSIINTPIQNNQNTTGQTATNQEPVCNIAYNTTSESKVVSENSPALITGFEKKCDGNYYVTFDYLGPGQGDPTSGDGGSFYTNTNFKLRTFKIDPNLKVKLTDHTEVSFVSYINSLQKESSVRMGPSFNQNNAYIRTGLTEPGIASSVHSLVVKNGIVISMNEVYLP